MHARIGRQYRTLVWWTMDVVGISRSLRWKVLIAVAIQFLVSVALTLVPLVVSGWARLWATAGLFGLASIAFVNTVLILEDDIITPILSLQEASRRIERGNLDVSVPATDQRDEIGDLCRTFEEMQHNLTVVANQAEALATQRFDDPVLEADVPGRFGSLLQRMTTNVKEYVQQVEADRDRFQLFNYLVGHDVPNLVNIIYARLDLLQDRCPDEEVRADLEVIEDQTQEIEYVANTVADLTTEKSVRRVDIKHVLVREVERIRDSFPDARVSLALPSDPVYLRCNDLLSRVCENLIVNGIEHDGGDAPRVEVTLEDAGEYVELTVSDEGPGLDLADPDRLFETVSEGTGLNIVHTIVTAFEGDIWLEETSSDGSTFVVRLPRDDAEAGQSEGTTDWFQEMESSPG